MMQVTEALELVQGTDGREYRCMRCKTALGRITENYKLTAVYEQVELTAANPHVKDPKRYVDDDMVLRRYYCPGCGVQLDVDICRAEDPPFHDIQIA
jgi:N-methylhydantoinase B